MLSENLLKILGRSVMDCQPLITDRAKWLNKVGIKFDGDQPRRWWKFAQDGPCCSSDAWPQLDND